MFTLSTALTLLHNIGPVVARVPEFVAMFNQAVTALGPTDQPHAQAALKDLQDGNDAGHAALQAKLAALSER